MNVHATFSNGRYHPSNEDAAAPATSAPSVEAEAAGPWKARLGAQIGAGAARLRGYAPRLRSQASRLLGHTLSLRRFLPRLVRTPVSALSAARLLRGGRVGDFQRMPRYAVVIFGGLVAIWVPVILYLSAAPLRYQSEAAMIMPGAGASSSVNLSEIGQASTSASSPYSSSAISPTVTYKSLMESRRVLVRAATSLDMEVRDLGRPRIKLLDQTSLIRVTMTGASPQGAAKKTEAVLAAFLGELDKLRGDEMARREGSTIDTVREHQEEVEAIRVKISKLQAETGLASAQQHLELVTMVENLGQQIVTTTSELREAEQEVEALSRMLRVDADHASAMLRLHADIEFGAISANAAKASAELSSLDGRFGPNHPQVVKVRNNLLGARLRMNERARTVTGLSVDTMWEHVDPSSDGQRSALLAQLVNLVTKRDGLAARQQTLKTEHEAARERVRNLIETVSRLDSLNRDYKVAEAVFASALARMNTTRNDVFASYPMVQVVEQPTIEWEPSSPKKKIALGAAGAASLFFLMGLTLTWIRRPLIDKLLTRGEDGAEPDNATA